MVTADETGGNNSADDESDAATSVAVADERGIVFDLRGKMLRSFYILLMLRLVSTQPLGLDKFMLYVDANII